MASRVMIHGSWYAVSMLRAVELLGLGLNVDHTPHRRGRALQLLLIVAMWEYRSRIARFSEKLRI